MPIVPFFTATDSGAESGAEVGSGALSSSSAVSGSSGLLLASHSSSSEMSAYTVARHAPHRESAVPFPALDGAPVAAEIRCNLFPAVQDVLIDLAHSDPWRSDASSSKCAGRSRALINALAGEIRGDHAAP